MLRRLYNVQLRWLDTYEEILWNNYHETKTTGWLRSGRIYANISKFCLVERGTNKSLNRLIFFNLQHVIGCLFPHVKIISYEAISHLIPVMWQRWQKKTMCIYLVEYMHRKKVGYWTRTWLLVTTERWRFIIWVNSGGLLRVIILQWLMLLAAYSKRGQRIKYFLVFSFRKLLQIVQPVNSNRVTWSNMWTPAVT